jgi:hypothetical protein
MFYALLVPNVIQDASCTPFTLCILLRVLACLLLGFEFLTKIMSVKIVMSMVAIDCGIAGAKKEWYEFRKWMFW